MLADDVDFEKVTNVVKKHLDKTGPQIIEELIKHFKSNNDLYADWIGILLAVNDLEDLNLDLKFTDMIKNSIKKQ